MNVFVRLRKSVQVSKFGPFFMVGAGYESHSHIASSLPPLFDSLLADNRQATPHVSLVEQFSSAALQVNCPIQLKASLYAVGETAGVEPIENGGTAERSQRIHLTIANPDSQITSIRLKVHGPSGWLSP
jgi:hypothetical protein